VTVGHQQRYRLTGLRALVVDDNQTNRRILRDLLGLASVVPLWARRVSPQTSI
jgi:CheY-like chemotaxis protein